MSWQPLLMYVREGFVSYALVDNHSRHGLSRSETFQLEEKLACSSTYQHFLDLSDECFWLWFSALCGETRHMPQHVLDLSKTFATPDAQVRSILHLTEKDVVPCKNCIYLSGRTNKEARNCQQNFVLTCQDVNRFKKLLTRHTSGDELSNFWFAAKVNTGFAAGYAGSGPKRSFSARTGEDEEEDEEEGIDPNKLFERLQQKECKRRAVKREKGREEDSRREAKQDEWILKRRAEKQRQQEEEKNRRVEEKEQRSYDESV
jgi:hypothetical protein